MNSRHPFWTADASDWVFYWSAHAGGKSFVNNNLFQHKKEDDDIFAGRVQRAYYYNYLRSLNLLAVDFIFTQPINRTPAEDPFYTDVDLKGTHIDKYVRDAAVRAIVQGVHFSSIDRPTTEAQIRSLADQENAGLRDYWIPINRPMLLNWELDFRGMPLWAMFWEGPPSEADPSATIAARAKGHQFIRLWERDTWTQFTVKVEKRGTRFKLKIISKDGPNEHDRGIVPVLPLYGEKIGDWDGESWNRDTSFISQNLLNVCSLRDDYNYETAIEQMIFPGMTEDKIQDMVKSSHYVIAAPAEGNAAYYLSASGKAAEILQQQIIDHRNEIHRIAKHRILNSSGASDAASGLSKQVDFEATNVTLGGLAKECERFENSMYEAMGKENRAEYPTEFDVNAIDRAIDQLMKVQTFDMPDQMMSLLLQDLADKLLSARSTQERGEVIKAIQEKFELNADNEFGIETTPTPAVIGGNDSQENDDA